MKRVLAIGTLAACAHTPDPTTPAGPVEPAATEQGERDLAREAAALDAQVAADLERLDALELFEVGELVGGDASEAFHCYGPCEGAEAEVDAYAERAEQLQELTDMAEGTAAQEDTCPMDDVDDAIASLRALQIVEVGAFVQAEAAPSPYCYNLPCPEDEAAAHETNCARATRLVTLASQR